MTRSTKPVQMARLTIGYQNILLPADKAMKVAEALQHAVKVERSWGDRAEVFTVEEEPLSVEFSLVHPSQIRMPSGEPFPAATTKPALPLSRPRLPR